jgi:hypothetical protein
VSLSLVGLPALIFFVGFVVVFSAPVWLAARLVRAKHPTLLRAVGSLALGMLGTAITAFFAGPLTLLFAPIVFVLSFKYVLGTSVIGSVLLAIVAAAGYALIGHWLGGGWSGMGGTGVDV